MTIIGYDHGLYKPLELCGNTADGAIFSHQLVGGLFIFPLSMGFQPSLLVVQWLLSAYSTIVH